MENYNIDKQLEKALTREPDFKLPFNFADRLVSMIEEARKKERRREIFWIGVVAVLFSIALAVVFKVTNFKPAFTGLTYLTNNLGLILFGLAFIVLLQMLDKKVIRAQRG